MLDRFRLLLGGVNMWLWVGMAVAFVCIFAIGAYAWYDHDIAYRTARRQLHEMKLKQQLLPDFRDVDIETIDLSNFDFELPPGVVLRQDIAYFLVARSFIWAPLVMIISVGFAWVVHLLVATTS